MQRQDVLFRIAGVLLPAAVVFYGWRWLSSPSAPSAEKLAGASAPDLIVTNAMKNSPMWGGWGGSRARHSGTMSVLYADGSVEGVRPVTIDPGNARTHDSLWKPEADAPLAP